MPFLPASLRRALRNLSIRRKLTAIVMLTSGVAVILASAGFLAYDYFAFREQMVTGLEATAEGLGLLAYPALDPREHRERRWAPRRTPALALILDSLRAYPSIEEAAIFDATGGVRGVKQPLLQQEARPPPFSTGQLARLPRRGPRPLPPGRDSPTAVFGGRRLPALEHAASSPPASSATSASSPGSPSRRSLASLLLASQLQKLISRPILHLAEVETRVSREKDYSLRAVKEADDELGVPHRRLQRDARPRSSPATPSSRWPRRRRSRPTARRAPSSRT